MSFSKPPRFYVHSYLYFHYFGFKSSADLDFSKPLSFNWTSITDQPSLSPCARSKLAACVCGHKIYLLGGRDGKFSAGDFWCFDTGMYG